MVVTWTTYDPDLKSIVHYGKNLNHLNLKQTGEVTLFEDGGRNHYIHRVTLSDLKPHTKYCKHFPSASGKPLIMYYLDYKCGSDKHWSKKFHFRTLSDETEQKPIKMLVFGDQYADGSTVPFIKQEVLQGNVDLVFHNGDIAYNLNDDNSKRGDDFMNTIQPYAAQIAYQTSVGNHENCHR